MIALNLNMRKHPITITDDDYSNICIEILRFQWQSQKLALTELNYNFLHRVVMITEKRGQGSHNFTAGYLAHG